MKGASSGSAATRVKVMAPIGDRCSECVRMYKEDFCPPLFDTYEDWVEAKKEKPLWKALAQQSADNRRQGTDAIPKHRRGSVDSSEYLRGESERVWQIANEAELKNNNCQATNTREVEFDI